MIILHPPRVSIRYGLCLQFMRGGLLEPVPVPPPWEAYTSRSITLQRGRAIALLRFVSIRSAHVCHTCVAGFLYQIRLRSCPFPVPRSPFPAFPRYTASSTAMPCPRRCCFSPPQRGGLLLLLLRPHIARLQRTSTAKVRRILIIANFKCKILHIFEKKVISY